MIKATAIIAIIGNTLCFAGSAETIGRRTTAKNSPDEVDHSTWSRLLTRYVDTTGMVNYSGWHGNAADRKALRSYLVSFSTVSSTGGTRNGRLALWINAYNALTIHGILKEYPTSSIRNHTAKLFGYNIWNDLKLFVGGREWSLEEIEHRILRKMNEPRIHFAIVCASRSCPRLLNTAYTPGSVHRQLESNARDFFSRRQNFRHDGRANRMQLSQILNWFGEDFGSSQPAQLRRISGWLPGNSAQAAARRGTPKVSFIPYDWALNEQNRKIR